MTTEMIDVVELPDDPKTLKHFLAELVESLKEKDRRIAQLTAQVDGLKRRLFGARSERIDPGQLQLGLDAIPPAPAPEEPPPDQPAGGAAKPRSSSKHGHGRGRLPKNLPRVRVEHDPAPEDRVCQGCGSELRRIGEEVTEQLEYQPASFLILEHVRGKYACKHCQENVVIGELPAQPIEKGLPGPGLLAHVLTSKYADHLPLYRQSQIFERHGLELSRSTLCDWVGESAGLLEPIVAEMRRQVLESMKIHTDDTPVPVQDETQKRTKLGRLWVYIGDSEHEHTVFDYTPNRSREGPLRFLGTYSGYLQADAYSGYDPAYATERVIEVACWAHCRRGFFEAQSSDAVRSLTALAFIRQLYGVEDLARGASAAERVRLRQQQAQPVLERFREWLTTQARVVLPRSPLGEAISYALNQWQALQRYLENGELEIDNNRAERALRCVVLGRKNWLFAGSDEGGRRAAIIFSLVASCKHLRLDPYAYLRDVLKRLPSHSIRRIAELTPKAWKETQEAQLLAHAA